ncbi:hypothetical protein AVEN_133637-1 [Araneus ventricosus]|uniref:Uncharacterized protein n=1 Tax=Araneus ventricosus TaxID=182803 RepID=A0A4Y2MS67_ARAVE|nr:hypothetical protein AVEN_133637-1 [Araneus ventricosus]
MVFLIPFFYLPGLIKDTLERFLHSCQDWSFESVDFWEVLSSPLHWLSSTLFKFLGVLMFILVVVLFFVDRIVHPTRQVEHNGVGRPDPNLARRNRGVRPEPPPQVDENE